MSITFGPRWGPNSQTVKTYLGVYQRPGLYHNPRPMHVATPDANLDGQTYILGTRTEKTMPDGNMAVMYEVKGLTNMQGRQAHFTAYYGPPRAAAVF